MFITKLQNVTLTSGTGLHLVVSATGTPLPKIEFFRTVNGSDVKLTSETVSQVDRVISSRYFIEVSLVIPYEY